MTIEFVCEHCGKALSTSDDKAGRKAKCPGCGEPVLVPGAAIAAAVDVPPPPIRPVGKSSYCAMCGTKIPAGENQCPACGEVVAEVERRPRQAYRGEPVAFEVGSVMSRSWQLFKEELGLVVGSQLIAGLLSAAALLPAFGLFFGGMVSADQGGDEMLPIVIVLFVLAGILAIVGAVVAIWLQVGAMQVLLGLVRGRSVSFSTLFQGKPFVLRYFLCSFIFNIMVQIGAQMCIIPGWIVQIIFWPYGFLLLDDDLPHVQALMDAPKLGMKSFLSTILLAIVSFGIFVLGLLAFIVGLFFAAPLVNLMWCVAYDEMRSSPYDDDNDDNESDVDDDDEV